MPPGRYTVKLTVGGQSFTQPLEVLKDPNSPIMDAGHPRRRRRCFRPFKRT